MFRAFRFCAELGFDIEPETLRAIYSNADKAGLISAERVRVELDKTLLSPRPEIAGEVVRAGLLGKYVVKKGDSFHAYHKQPMKPSPCSTPSSKSPCFRKIAELPVDPTLRWCAFIALMQERRMIASAAKLFLDMRIAGKVAKDYSAALEISALPADRISLKRLLSRYGVDTIRCAAAINDTLAIQFQRNREGDTPASPQDAQEESPCSSPSNDWLVMVDEIIASGECFAQKDLAVKGSDLIESGYPPGRELGKKLSSLLNHVLEHPEDNTREVLLSI